MDTVARTEMVEAELDAMSRQRDKEKKPSNSQRMSEAIRREVGKGPDETRRRQRRGRGASANERLPRN